MPLFWIVHDLNGKRFTYIREDSTLLYARLRGAMDGSLTGEFVEGMELDEASARKVPKRMRNRMLTLSEVKKLGRSR